MRSVFIFVLCAALLLLHRAAFAETNAECLTRCATEKASRDAVCPNAGDRTEQAAAECLQESLEMHAGCSSSCPEAAPGDAPEEAPIQTPPEAPAAPPLEN
jgi:hypothetical protein